MQTVFHAAEVRLAGLLPAAAFFGAGDIGVERCTCDSRRVRPGDLFVALPGSQNDGHDFIPQAVAAGASAVVVERPVEVSVPQCVVSDAREAYGRICQALAGNPSRSLKVVGITGTNGKTTTSWLLASILAVAGKRAGLAGTLGSFDGAETAEQCHTTPPADELAGLLARMVANQCTHAILEVSSHSLAQSRVGGVVFDAACVTNVRHDHLDYHGTAAAYRQAKGRLFDQLAPEGFAVINADDPGAAGYLRQLDGPTLTVGIDAAAEIMATPIEQCLSEQAFLLTAGSENAVVRTPMIGRHHIENCLVAAAAALAYGIPLVTIARGLESVRGVPGRLERIECGQPFGVFVDYAHTPDALAAALAALRASTAGRLICVFGAGGQRDRLKRPKMARAVELAADLAVVTADNPRGEDPRQIAREVLAGFENPRRVRSIDDRAAAIGWALEQADAGDCVLIAGKGHERLQIVGNQSIPFDDAELVRRWLYHVQPGKEPLAA